MTELTTIDPNNYGAMAKAMGIANEAPAKAKSSSLARLRINHSPIMGTAEVKGKSVNVETVSGGTYKLEIPDGDTYFANSVKLRPHMQRFMYKRFIPAVGNGKANYNKTIMADSLNIDLKDNYGGFNCGRPSGYVKDFDSLPQETQDLMRSTDRFKIIFGLCTLDSPKDAEGKPTEVKEFPFLMRIKNRDSFKAMTDLFSQIQRKNRLPIQHLVHMSSQVKSIPSGATYAVMKPYLGELVEIDTDDQETLNNFVEWVESMNTITLSKWEEHHRPDELSGDEEEIASKIIEIEE